LSEAGQRLAIRGRYNEAMIYAITWRRVALVVFTLATFAVLLYTVGAPFEHGG
jgi:hypothetical protein